MSGKRSLWARAAELAGKAPPERNRAVDFLRALSILAVVSGHWLVAAPWIEDGAVRGGHLLGILPWTQWLTWGFQVMPLFFLVGGFANGVAWAASQRSEGNWPDWFASRVRRLIVPVLPLFLVWTLFALFGTALGVERGIVKMAAQLALIPVWFLAVYLLVTALTPLTLAAWRRLGFGSFWLLAVLDERFERAPHFDLPQWWREAQTRFEASLFTATALLRASQAGMARLARLSPRGREAVRGASAPDAQGWAQLEMPVEDSDHGARELLGIGPEIEVLAPPGLRQRIADLASGIASIHQGERK